jgi:hypothetical protein
VSEEEYGSFDILYILNEKCPAKGRTLGNF